MKTRLIGRSAITGLIILAATARALRARAIVQLMPVGRKGCQRGLAPNRPSGGGT